MNNALRLFFKSILVRVPIQDKINFARHLAIIIKAGLPLIEGLKIIKKQTASSALSRIIDQVIVDVSNGQSLAVSLSRFPEVFNDFFVNIVRVGEISGTLMQNLQHVASELKNEHDLKSKIRSAMIYPVIIFFATSALISFLIFFAFPKILPIFTSLNVQLPLPTRILIAVSGFIIANGAWVVVGAIIFFICMKILLKIPTVRLLLNKMSLFIPILSHLTIDINTANFTRVLSVLLEGGIKIVEATTISAQTFDNLVYRRTLLEAAERIRKGEQLAICLAAHKKVFPPLLVGLIEIGEGTGNLVENLKYLSEYYREESELSLRNLTTILEPLLLLTMGLLVGFVAISVITPIYSISQGIGAK